MKPFLVVAVVSAILTTGCLSGRIYDGNNPDPILIIEKGQVWNDSGDTISLLNLEGHYVLSPRRMEKLLLQPR